MRRVTLLLSGVPRYVTLPDLSYNLDRLFNTDEIGTFKIRDLPNNPQTNRRQIALDFMSSFDAMAAQEKLDYYQYEMDDGGQYTLRAKINKAAEYMCSESRSPERCGHSSWYGSDWQSLIPDLDGVMYHKANATLDAQLELVKKQQIVLETEKEILREKRRLKMEYGSMVSSFCQYEVPSQVWMEKPYQYVEKLADRNGYDESETSSKPSRSRSRDHRSGSWHRRSRSRERIHRDSRRKSSRDRAYILPQIEWHDEEPAKRRDQRSRSKNGSIQGPRHPSSRCGSRLRSKSKERHYDHGTLRDRAYRDRRSISIEWGHRESSKEIRSNERGNSDKQLREKNYRDLRTPLKERMARDGRSRSKDRRSRLKGRRSRSKERGRIHKRSCSRERACRNRKHMSREREYRRSRSREGMCSSHGHRSTCYRRLRSRDRETNHETRLRLDLYRRRSRSSERSQPLAIMPRSPKRRNTRTARDIVSYDDDYSLTDNITWDTDIQNEKKYIKLEKEENMSVNEKATSTNKHRICEIVEDSSKTPKSKEEKRIAKFNRKVKKAEMLESKVKAFTKDIMVLVIILLDELMNKDNVEISPYNKVLLIKKLKSVVEERVEPLARLKKCTDVEVLRRYKKLYPREVDLVMIKQILDKMPKIQVPKSQSTVTVSTQTFMPHVPDPVITKAEDIEEQQEHMNNLTPSENVPSKSSSENFPQIKQEPIIIDLDVGSSSPSIKTEQLEVEEKSIIIDIDSADKPVSRHPQFVVVIKQLVTKMDKVGVRRLLDQNELKIKHFHFVLRHILKDLLKGHGYIPRPSEIISRFREVYPEDEDEEFVKNVIKDIRDGMYPGCMDLVEVKTEDDCPDDAVLAEKPHDVVTVGDSDVEEDMKLKMEIINLECEHEQDIPSLSSIPENPRANEISPHNTSYDNSVNNTDSAKPLTDLSQKQAKTGCPAQLKPVSENSGQAIVSPANPNQAKLAEDMPSVVNPGQDKAPAFNGQAEENGTNHGHAKRGPVYLGLTIKRTDKEHRDNLTPAENVDPSKSSNEDFPHIKQEPIIIDIDSESSSPSIKTEKLEVEEKPIIIDIDSADKPVPRHPQFVVVIKQLVTKMNKVQVRRLLDQNELKIKHFHFVLRHILRDLLKGRGYIPRPEIISRFREVYPVDKDEEFVKNVIKDIKDGMYPGCTDYIDMETEDDCPDDVVLVEKPHDVVTVGDSDDEEDTKLRMEVINIECEHGQDMPSPSPIPENPRANEISPDNTSYDNSVKITDSAKPLTDLSQKQANAGCPAQLKPVSKNSDQAIVSPANPNQAKLAQDMPSVVNPGQDKAPAFNGQAEENGTNRGHAKTGPVYLGVTNKKTDEDKKKTASMVEISDLGNETGKVPGAADSTIQSNTESAKESQAEDCQNNGRNVDITSQVSNKDAMDNHVDYSNELKDDQVQDHPNTKENDEENDSNVLRVTAITIMTSLDDLISKTTKSNETEEVPVKDIKEEEGLEYEEDEEDTKLRMEVINIDCEHGQDMPSPSPIPENPRANEISPDNTSYDNSVKINDSAKPLTDLSQKQANAGCPAQLKPVSKNSDQAIVSPANPNQAKLAQDMPSVVNPGQDKAPAFNGQAEENGTNRGHAKTGPVYLGVTNKKTDEDKKKTASMVEISDLGNETGEVPGAADSTIQSNTESPKESQAEDCQNNGRNVDITSQVSNKDAMDNHVDYSNELKDDQVQDHPNTKENDEENDSNVLRVTAITIMTSLDDLISKTTKSNETEEVPVKDIKEEEGLEYEEGKLDDSSLQLVPDSGPTVTSITIMTSDAELFSIGQEDGNKHVNEIKNEEKEDTCFENLFNEIETDINNDKFSLQMNNKHKVFNITQTGPPEHNCSELNLEINRNNKDLPQESITDDDDETIESIGRFIASLY